MIFYRILCSKILLSIWETYSLQIEPLQLRVTVKDNMRNNLKDRAFCSLQQVLISLGTLCLHMKIKRFSEILKTINEVRCWKCYSAEWSLFRKQKYSLIALGGYTRVSNAFCKSQQNEYFRCSFASLVAHEITS